MALPNLAPEPAYTFHELKKKKWYETKKEEPSLNLPKLKLGWDIPRALSRTGTAAQFEKV